MSRIADRPAAHAGAQLHKFYLNRRGEHHGIIATLLTEVGRGLSPAADHANACGSFSRPGDFGHFFFATFPFASSAGDWAQCRFATDRVRFLVASGAGSSSEDGTSRAARAR